MLKNLINKIRKSINNNPKIIIKGFDNVWQASNWYFTNYPNGKELIYSGKPINYPEKLLINCLESRVEQDNQRYFKDYNYSNLYPYKSARDSLNSLLKGKQYCIIYKKKNINDI